MIPQPIRFPTCSGCHQPSTIIHEYCQRSIRDLPILGRAVRLNVELRGVGCGACGKRIESVSWLDRYSRMTKRLAEAVIQACERLPTPHVAEMFGLHWDSVRLLERRALQAALEKLPKAHVVYNLFDAVAKYGREVIDRVRVDKTNRLRHHKPARKVIKQARWLLLCNAENLKREDQQVRLQDLLAPNQSLMTVYLMKAELKALWSPATALGLAVSLEALHLADESAMPALKQFAKRLKGCWRGTKQGEMA